MENAFYPYPIDPAADEQMARARVLAEVLEDCVDLYMREIAEDEPEDVQRRARIILAMKLTGLWRG